MRCPMYSFGDPMTKLVSQLSRLPGIGPKTAQRLAMYIIQMEESKVRDMAQSMLDAKEKMHYCSICCNLSDRNPCSICLLYTSDAADDLLCVDLGGRRII